METKQMQNQRQYEEPGLYLSPDLILNNLEIFTKRLMNEFRDLATNEDIFDP